MRTGVAGLVVAMSLASATCTSEEVLRVAGQTLYNSGRYLCTQNASCDPGDADRGPPASTNRR